MTQLSASTSNTKKVRLNSLTLWYFKNTKAALILTRLFAVSGAHIILLKRLARSVGTFECRPPIIHAVCDVVRLEQPNLPRRLDAVLETHQFALQYRTMRLFLHRPAPRPFAQVGSRGWLGW